MSANIPPLVSSSPPPLCDSDDEEDDDDNEFGMFATAEDLDYNDCVPFPTTNETKLHLSEGSTHTNKHRGTEQDSTSQDSTTDSGLCPDSEGMSPTPHSDDERTDVVKVRVCERLKENSELNNHKKTCVNNENGTCYYVGTINNIRDSITASSNNLETQTFNCCDSESEILNNTDSCDDFGSFEFASVRDECFSNSNHLQNNDSSISESGKCESQETEVFNGSRASSTNSININEEHSDKIMKSVLPIEDGSEKDILDILSLNQVVVNENTEVTDLILDPVVSSIEEEKMGCDLAVSEISEEIFEGAQGINLSEESDIDNFGDFQFESIKPVSETNKIHLDSHPQAECVEPHFEEENEIVEFDDFADFSSSDFSEKDRLKADINNTPIGESSFHLSQTKEEDDQKMEPNQLSSDESWCQLFPIEDSKSISSECFSITVEESLIWRKLYPIEASPALSYQWSNSSANKKLLSALNIDSRNILFMPWCNMSVPRFAANLGFGPLEPVRASEPLQPTFPPPLPTSASPSEETVPDAHFDWVSSGLTNPLDCSELKTTPFKSLSSEAEKIVQMLPNLSYMKKTYLEFATTKDQ